MTVAIADGTFAKLEKTLDRVIRDNFPQVTFRDVRVSIAESYSGDSMIEILAAYEGDMQQLHGPERRGLLVRLQDAIWDEGVDAFPNLYFVPEPRHETTRP